MAEKVGFIGPGIMGLPMAGNLMKAGYWLFVYDIVQEAVKRPSGRVLLLVIRPEKWGKMRG